MEVMTMKKIVLFLGLAACLLSLVYVNAKLPVENPVENNVSVEEIEDEGYESSVEDLLIEQLRSTKAPDHYSAVQMQIAMMQLKELQKMREQSEKKSVQFYKEDTLYSTASDAFFDTIKDISKTFVTYGIAMPMCFFTWLQIYNLSFATGVPQFVVRKGFWDSVYVAVEILDSIGGSKGLIKVPASWLGLI